MGSETSDSTSSGAIPCASVSIVTVGAVRSGKTSTGMRCAVHAPATSVTAASASTTTRCVRDHAMSLFSMVGASMLVAMRRHARRERCQAYLIGGARHDALARLESRAHEHTISLASADGELAFLERLALRLYV